MKKEYREHAVRVATHKDFPIVVLAFASVLVSLAVIRYLLVRGEKDYLIDDACIVEDAGPQEKKRRE